MQEDWHFSCEKIKKNTHKLSFSAPKGQGTELPQGVAETCPRSPYKPTAGQRADIPQGVAEPNCRA